MIQMCELHQIDLIVTKSVSRFARNAKESLAYVRKLKLLGIGVQFEKEGIFTLALGDEMLLNTFSAIAQEESKAISQNQRLSIVKRMEDGEYVDSNAPYGFRLINKELSVYEPEAEIVRTIFRLYLNGFSTSELARELNARNIPRKQGKVFGALQKLLISWATRNTSVIADTKRLTEIRPFRSNNSQTGVRKTNSTHREHTLPSLTRKPLKRFNSCSRSGRMLSRNPQLKIYILLRAAFSVLSAARFFADGLCREMSNGDAANISAIKMPVAPTTIARKESMMASSPW
jgi:DNA invertase Pin-like site-specific DNA recombinase